MATKAQRQHQVAGILAENAITSQAQLVDLLNDGGLEVTQATVSRDLEELGAVKVRVPGGATVYAVPEHPAQQFRPTEHLKRVLGDWLGSVQRSGDLLVLRTPPGSAHVVASALDRSDLKLLLGTVAGDDTVLAISVEGKGKKLVDQLNDLAQKE